MDKKRKAEIQKRINEISEVQVLGMKTYIAANQHLPLNSDQLSFGWLVLQTAMMQIAMEEAGFGDFFEELQEKLK